MTQTPLPEDLAEFVAGPVFTLIATADASNRPSASRVWCVMPSGDRTKLTVLVAPEFDQGLEVGREAALSMTDVLTAASYQFKGPIVERRPTHDGDQASFEAHREGIFELFAQLFGPDAENLQPMVPLPVTAVTVGVRDIYDQTPGPGAGRRFGEEVAS